VRHGFLLSGTAGSGKSEIFECLKEANGILDAGVNDMKWKRVIMNPKAITSFQM